MQLRLNLSPCMPQYHSVVSALQDCPMSEIADKNPAECPRMSQAHWQVCIVSIFGRSAWRVRPWHNLGAQHPAADPVLSELKMHRI